MALAAREAMVPRVKLMANFGGAMMSWKARPKKKVESKRRATYHLKRWARVRPHSRLSAMDDVNFDARSRLLSPRRLPKPTRSRPPSPSLLPTVSSEGTASMLNDDVSDVTSHHAGAGGASSAPESSPSRPPSSRSPVASSSSPPPPRAASAGPTASLTRCAKVSPICEAPRASSLDRADASFESSASFPGASLSLALVFSTTSSQPRASESRSKRFAKVPMRPPSQPSASSLAPEAPVLMRRAVLTTRQEAGTSSTTHHS
mmetsp:Transcript_4594/g.11844  ORF Transcript_4594/g.11844 Transcript_4594/m.11844 type:complete len:261 (-) Transcript_4594:17-799(-)